MAIQEVKELEERVARVERRADTPDLSERLAQIEKRLSALEKPAPARVPTPTPVRFPTPQPASLVQPFDTLTEETP